MCPPAAGRVKAHNPFESGERLIRLDSGMVDENDSVNCDRKEEIGASIQCKLDGVSFANSIIQKKK
jgi:hypothetical protein